MGRLLCASNANNVLTDFISTGVYDRRRPLHKTQSPSMDILVSSNLERLLALLSGDPALVANLMEQLRDKGFYRVPDRLLSRIQADFFAGYCDDSRGSDAIGRVYRELGYLMDPHTAAGWVCGEQYRAETGDTAPLVVLSTASPYKFPAAVLAAIGQEAMGDEFDQMEQLSACTGMPIPRNLANLRQKKQRHTAVVDKDAMLDFVLRL